MNTFVHIAFPIFGSITWEFIKRNITDSNCFKLLIKSIWLLSRRLTLAIMEAVRLCRFLDNLDLTSSFLGTQTPTQRNKRLVGVNTKHLTLHLLFHFSLLLGYNLSAVDQLVLLASNSELFFFSWRVMWLFWRRLGLWAIYFVESTLLNTSLDVTYLHIFCLTFMR